MEQSQLLRDPVSLETLEDPVTVPCCGQTFSRASLENWFDDEENNPNRCCPLCRESLIDRFDVHTAPSSVIIRNLLETENSSLENEAPRPLMSIPTIDITCIKSPNGLVLGKADMKTIAAKHGKKQYIIVAIDVSGSMQRIGAKQIDLAMEKLIDICFTNPNTVSASVLAYDHACPPAIQIDTTVKTRDEYKRRFFNEARRGGGTSFDAAFVPLLEEIERISKCPGSADEGSVIHVIFMTDGAGRYSTLDSTIQKLRCFPMKTMVHTCGFGDSFCTALLEKLHKAGTEEGQYRMADPSDNPDVLYQKLEYVFSACTNSVAQLSSLSISHSFSEENVLEIVHPSGWVLVKNIESLKSETGVDWIIQNKGIELDRFKIRCIEEQNLTESEQKLLSQEWFSLLVNRLAQDISLAQDPNTIIIHRALRLELLMRQCSALELYSLDNRLPQLKEMLRQMMMGKEVNALALKDLQHGSGGTKTRTIADSGTAVVTATTIQTKSLQIHDWIHTSCPRFGNDNNVNNDGELYQPQRDEHSIHLLIRQEDWEGVFYSAYHGHYSNVTSCNINEMSSIRTLEKFPRQCIRVNPLDIAIIRGHYKTANAILNAYPMICPNLHDDTLRDSCNRQGWTITLRSILNSGLIQRKIDINETWESLLAKFKLHLPKYATIAAEVPSKAASLPLRWQDHGYLVAAIQNKQTNAFETLKFLLERGWIDPLAELSILDSATSEVVEITTPFFIACEKGNANVVDLFLPTVMDRGALDWQNKRGTTALWIACCNGHQDIVMMLLASQANVNVCNAKGDSALVACVEKNQVEIARILLAANIDIFAHNRNRDNVFILCCRKNLAGMLRLLLNAAERLGEAWKVKALTDYAEIDGFSPVFAAVELNNVQALKVLAEFNADLYAMTEPDNAILPLATPAHLAAHYGCLDAIKALLDLGVPIGTIRDGFENTPLHIAVKRGHGSIIEFLLSPVVRSNVRAMNTDGQYPIQLASKETFDRYFVNKLVMYAHEALRSPAVRDSEVKLMDEFTQFGEALGVYTMADEFLDQGRTFLTAFILSGNVSFAANCIKRGASASTVDDYGMTPASWLAFMSRSGQSSSISSTFDVKRLNAFNGQFLESLCVSLENSNYDFQTTYRALTSAGETQDAAITIPFDLVEKAIGSASSSLSRVKCIGELRKIMPNVVQLEAQLRIISYFGQGKNDSTFLPSDYYLLFSLFYLTPEQSCPKYTNIVSSILNKLPDETCDEVYTYNAGLNTNGIESLIISGESMSWDSWSRENMFRGDWGGWSSKTTGILFILEHPHYLKDVTEFSRNGSSCKTYLYSSRDRKLKIDRFYRYGVTVLGQKNIRHNYLLSRTEALNDLTVKKSPIIIVLREIDE
jgi:ankyrin repeat protein